MGWGGEGEGLGGKGRAWVPRLPMALLAVRHMFKCTVACNDDR